MVTRFCLIVHVLSIGGRGLTVRKLFLLTPCFLPLKFYYLTRQIMARLEDFEDAAYF